MMKDDNDISVDALKQHINMEEAQDYLSRGRRFAENAI